MKNKRIAVLLLAAMVTVSSWPGQGVTYAAGEKQSTEIEQMETEPGFEEEMNAGETEEAKTEESSQRENDETENDGTNDETTEDGKNTEDAIATSEEVVSAAEGEDSPEKHSDTPVEVSSLGEARDLSIVTYSKEEQYEAETRTWDVPLNITISGKSQPFDSSSWSHTLGGVEMLEAIKGPHTCIFNKPVNITIDNCQGTELQLVRRDMSSTYGRWVFNAPVTFTVKNSSFDYIQCMQVYNTGGEYYSEREKNWGVEMNDTYTINIENCQKYNTSVRGIELIGGSKKMTTRSSTNTGLATEVWKTGVHKGITMNVKDTDVYSLTVGHYIITGKDQTNPDFFMEGECNVNLDNSNVLGAFESSIGMATMKDSLDFDGSINVKLTNGSNIRTFYSEGTVYTSSTAIGKTTGGTTLELTEPASIVGLKGVELLKIAGRVDVTALMELSAKGMKIDVTNPADWNNGDVLLNYKYTAGSRPAVNQANVSSNWNNSNLILDYKDENSNQQWYLTKDVTVTFDSDGGTDVASQTVRQGSVVTKPTPAPTKTNSIFEGWYTDKTYATAWTFADPVNQDMTLYAKWRAEIANVKVTEKDGKEYGTITVDKGTPITGDKLSTVNVEKKGYTVEKWTTSDGKDWNIENDNVTADMEIHPVWKLNAPQATLGAENNITTVHIGDTVKLTAQATHEAEGNITYQFQWFKDGKEIKANKTKSKATARAVSDTSELVVDESGEYSVKVLASDGAQTAEAGAGPVSVTVTPHQFGGDWKHDAKDHWHECTIENCGVKDQVEAHIFSEWTVVKEATTKEQGERERSCTTCGYKETEKIPMTENEAPVISAKDKDITVGDTFDVKADVKATDKEDGDLTDKIEVVKNTVDTSKAGTYEVTYQVTDTDGATTTLTIKVAVKDKAADVPKDDPKDPDTTKPGNADDKNTTIITKKETKVITEKTPRTGDETRTGVILLGFVAGAAGIVEALRRKKRTNN